jgi:mycofactocin precursor
MTGAQMTVATTAAPAEATTSEVAEPAGAEPTGPGSDHRTLVEEDLLVEDVSIDGMCGVY